MSDPFPYQPPATEVAIHLSDSRFTEATLLLAERLELPLLRDQAATKKCRFVLEYCIDTERSERRLQLRDPSDTGKPLIAEFRHGRLGFRRRFGGGRNQPLARAAGLIKGARPRVIDATGGLCRDAAVLAELGADVTAIERSPILAALLQDGLERARIGATADDFTQRLTIICADSRHYLASLPAAQQPDIIYLDPMYPHREKSAAVQKEMLRLRALVGDDSDAPALLAAALLGARRRVVVKRPRLAPALAGPEPGGHIAAPNTRFDLYPIFRRATI